MDKLLFNKSEWIAILKKQKLVKNKIIISSSALLVLFTIITIFFVQKNKTLYILSSIVLIFCYSFYLFVLLTIKLPKLKSYQKFLSIIETGNTQVMTLEVKRVLNYFITRDNLEFYEITFYLDDTHKQQLSLYLEKSLVNSFQENKKYQVTICSKYICSYTEVK